ncbi:LysR family transcriptional regulator [Kutzneria sp. 744]|uniref:LysR family transcriptional regulator n=1 Tax=Kutzneria sp. (strain 744) TaxID=345341 RepID=UPI0003EEB9B8|nr:LysR family transcriptional regulator [Kutzneria sp. 744]EWM15016.1 LysR-family transcriptional regulator [Kutzneria sp. 744]
MSTAQELVALRSFLAVYRTGGVARAAEQLGLSQPAVSHHLRAVETFTGRPLFARAGRGIAPTEAGHALAAEVAPHLDVLDLVIDGRRADAVDAGPVFLGSPGSQFDHHIAAVLGPLADQGICLRHRIGLSDDLVAALLDDRLDIAVITKIEGTPRSRLHLRHWFDEEFVLVGRPDQPPFHPSDLPRRLFIGYSEEMPMFRRYFRSCWDLPAPPAAVTMPDMTSIITYVAASTLLSVIPLHHARPALASGRLALLHRPSTPVLNPVYLATRRGRQSRPHLKTLFDALLATPGTR